MDRILTIRLKPLRNPIVLSSCLMLVLLCLPIIKALPFFIRLSIALLAVLMQIIYVIGIRNITGVHYYFFLNILFIISCFFYAEHVSDSTVFLSYLLYILELEVCVGNAIILYDYSDYNEIEPIEKLFSFLMIATAITTTIGSIQHPDAMRELGSPETEQKIYLLMNIGGFDFVYALPMCIPLWMYKRDLYQKNGYYIAIAIALICVLAAQYSIAIGITLIVFVLTLFRRLPLKKLLALVGIGVLVLVIMSRYLTEIIYSLYLLFKGYGLDWIADRILAVYIYARQGEQIGDLELRVNVYKKSIDSFVKSPVFGGVFKNYSSSNVGGHSALFDTLATSGFFGIAGMLFVAILILKKFHFSELNTVQVNCLLIILGGFLIFFFLQPIWNCALVAAAAFLISQFICIKEPEKSWTIETIKTE